MGSTYKQSAISAVSRAEVHILGEVLLPLTLCVSAGAEDCAVGTVDLEMGHLSIHKEMKTIIAQCLLSGHQQPSWSLPSRVSLKKQIRDG